MTTTNCNANLSVWLEQLKSTMTRKVSIVLSTQPAAPAALVDCMLMVVHSRVEVVECANQPLRMHIAKPRPCTSASPFGFAFGALDRIR